jgi:biopolymer transport protein ExbD
MAFSGMSSNGSRGRGRWRSSGSLSEMNVVPLVDVVLVLLIIFMVTATAAEFGLELEVPKVKHSSSAIADSPVISITKRKETYLGQNPTKVLAMASELKRRYPDAKDVIIRADKSVPVELLVQVLSAVGDAKLKVKMATQAEEIRRP